MSRSVTNSSQFDPTPAMRVWLDTAVKSLTDNVSEISKECSVSRQSWYRWVQDDDFRAWYRKEWDKRLGLLAISLDLIGLKKAGEDFRYWEAMQKRVGSFESTSGASIGMHESLVIYSPDREKMRK